MEDNEGAVQGKIFEGRTFEGRKLVIDGNTYRDCTFRNCTLIYKGGRLPVLERNHFDGFQVKFEEAAERTVQMLMGFYHGFGDTGRQLVEAVFANIQRGGPPQRGSMS